MPTLQQPGDEAQRDSFSAPLQLRDAGSPAEDHGRRGIDAPHTALPDPRDPQCGAFWAVFMIVGFSEGPLGTQ